MMMARDRTPQRPELDGASIELLTSALSRYVDAGEEGAGLTNVLRHVAEEARGKCMHAEQLLIILKDVWYSLPAIRRMPDGDEQSRMLQRLITLCIRHYYGS